MPRSVCQILAVLLTCFSLGACVRIDPDQARICRIVLAALHPPGTPISVVSLAMGVAPHSIVIRHETVRAPHPPREHLAECRFAGGRLARDRLELEAVILNGRPLNAANLHLLRRFWVDEPGTAAFQPPVSEQEASMAPEVSRTTALLLQHSLSAIPQISAYLLLAPAYALIYGLIGRINLAFGELAVIGGQGALIGAIGGAMLSDASPLGMLAGGLLLALAAAATHADVMGRHVMLPLGRAGGQTILVATIGLSAALMEYVRLAQGDGIRWTPPLLNVPVSLARNGDFVVTVTEGAVVFSSVALFASALLLARMRFSRFGREWRAAAQDSLAAALHGVDPRRVLMQAMAISGLLAGLAGFIMTAHYGGIGFSGGLGLGLKALIAAVLGGIGSLGGAMLGALVLGAFEALWSAFLPLHLKDAAVFTLLVLLLVLKPGGLLGAPDADSAWQTRSG